MSRTYRSHPHELKRVRSELKPKPRKKVVPLLLLPLPEKEPLLPSNETMEQLDLFK
jgi:hypothetical protein